MALGAAYLVPHPAVLIVVGVLPLAAVFAFRNPFLLCLLFILFTFFRLHEAFPVLNPLRLPNMLALGSLTVLGAWVVTKRLRFAWGPELKLFSILFGLMTLGVPLASGRDIAIAYWKDTYVKIAIMTFAIASLARGRRISHWQSVPSWSRDAGSRRSALQQRQWHWPSGGNAGHGGTRHALRSW